METASGPRHPDLVILDGAAWTGVNGAPSIEAVALTGNRISATGTNIEVRDLVGPGTEVISAGGNTVMPGIVDAHNHVRLGRIHGLCRCSGQRPSTRSAHASRLMCRRTPTSTGSRARAGPTKPFLAADPRPR